MEYFTFLGKASNTTTRAVQAAYDAGTFSIVTALVLDGIYRTFVRDSNNNYYIAAGSAVYKYDKNFSLVTAWASNGRLTSADWEHVNRGSKTIAVTSNEELLFSGRAGDYTDKIFCYNSAGNLKWSFLPLTSEYCQSIAITSDRTLLVAPYHYYDKITELSIATGTVVATYTVSTALGFIEVILPISGTSIFWILGFSTFYTRNYYAKYAKGCSTALILSSDDNKFYHYDGISANTTYFYKAGGESESDGPRLCKCFVADGISTTVYSLSSDYRYFKAISFTSAKHIVAGAELYSSNTTLETCFVFDLDLNYVDSHRFYQSYTEANIYVMEGAGSGGWYLPPLISYTKNLIAVSKNRIHLENPSTGTFSEITAARDEIDVSKDFEIASAFRKAFIANESNLKILDMANYCLPTSAISGTGTAIVSAGTIIGKANGTALTAPKFIVDFITSSTGSANVYAFRIAAGAIASGDTLQDETNAVKFALSSAAATAPHFYDWTPYGNDSNYGAMPETASLVAVYRGRLVLAGNKYNPEQWYMSRQGNPYDWAYAANDAQSPVAGLDADAGKAGDTITALIPYSDDYLIIGCLNSIWKMKGDPAAGGSLDILTDKEGIFSSRSWCWDNEGNLYYVSRTGISMIPSGIGEPQSLTEGVLPHFVEDWELDPSLHRITMAYDRNRYGILIVRTALSTGSCLAYWYDLKTKGFFPESYPSECGIYSMLFYDADDDDYRKLLLGCKDGYIRYFDDSSKDDNIGATTTAIDSYVTLPLEQLNEDPDKEGKLTSLTFEVAGGAAGGDFSDTDGFDYFIYTGDDKETVLEDIKDGASAVISGVLTGPGRKARIRKKVRGAVIGIKIANTASAQTWALNRVFGVVKPVGRIR